MVEVTQPMYRDITINPECNDEEIHSILSEIRPLWKKEDICSVKQSGGKINTMKCYHLVEDSDKIDAIVVRIFNPSIEGLGSRDIEFMAMQVSHAAGCFPVIYACFNNGFIYHYAQGRPMTLEDFTKPDSVSQSALMLCRFHHIDTDALDLMNLQGKPVKFVQAMQTLREVLAWIPEKASNPEIDISFQEYRKDLTNDVLQTEITYMENILKDLPFSTSLNHGDLYFGNMLLEDTTGKVILLDYELAGFNYRSRDLAMLFCWMPLLQAWGVQPNKDVEFTPDMRNLWLESYLKAHYECLGKDANDIPSVERELFDIEHQILEIHSYLELTLMLLATIDAHKDNKVVSISALSMELYYNRKSSCVQLKEKYVNIKGSGLTMTH